LDFATVLGVVSGFLEEKGFRYAVIGGVALIGYGLPRTTLDLDFIVESSAQADLIEFLESRGYKTLHQSAAKRARSSLPVPGPRQVRAVFR
jgi:hypothetical protein